MAEVTPHLALTSKTTSLLEFHKFTGFRIGFKLLNRVVGLLNILVGTVQQGYLLASQINLPEDYS